MISKSITCLFIILFCSNNFFAQHENILSLDMLYEVIRQSRLTYVINTNNYQPDSTDDNYPVLSNQLYFKKDSLGNKELCKYTISSEAENLLFKADSLYKHGNGARASGCYVRVMQLEPDYYHVYTLIADMFYYDKNYSKAKDLFLHSIKHNFIDYDAHWFLADAYHKLGILDSMLNEITIAHLLNVNHKSVRLALSNYRKLNGKQWDDWDFSPRYSISKTGNKININAAQDWLPYAIVKALWKYEPGFAEGMLEDSDAESLASTNFPEEKLAILAYLSNNANTFKLNLIIREGFIDEFIMYEIIAKKDPVIILLQDRMMFDRLIEYVNKFH